MFLIKQLRMNNSTRISRTTKRTKRRVKRRNRNPRAPGEPLITVIPRNLGIVAPRTRVTLRFQKTVTISNSTLFTANQFFTPTFLYDVDPVIGSTAVPGFTEYAAFYRQYVLISSRCTFRVMNNEAFPLLAFIVPTNGAPTANQSLSTTFTQLAQPVCVTKAIGAVTGNGIGTLVHEYRTSNFAGAHDVTGDPAYFGATSGGSPTNNWYWNIGYTSGLAGTAAGALVQVTIELDTEFFEIAVVLN